MISILILTAGAFHAARNVDLVVGQHGPEGNLIISRPSIFLRVFDEDGRSPTAFSVSLNGQIVEAKYSQEAKGVSYTPEFPLVDGTYQISVKAQFEGFEVVERNWEIRILPDALQSLPGLTPKQESIVDELNRWRRKLGLPEYGVDLRLSIASQRHAEYLLQNKTTGHIQKEGKPGFFGVRPDERLKLFGWNYSSREGVTYGTDRISDAVAKLFYAPYHRLPILQPGPSRVGAGYAVGRVVVGYEATEAKGVVVSPADGETGVPVQFTVRERPDPLRVHPNSTAPYGYPLVFANFDPEDDRIAVSSAELKKEDGTDVPILLNTPANDRELRSAAIIFSQRPLEPSTYYTVAVTARDSTGADISKTWSFTTTSGEVPPARTPVTVPMPSVSDVLLVSGAAFRLLGGPFGVVPELVRELITSE